MFAVVEVAPAVNVVVLGLTLLAVGSKVWDSGVGCEARWVVDAVVVVVAGGVVVVRSVGAVTGDCEPRMKCELL